MADAETFIKDFHTKNQASLERHLTTLRSSITRENLDVADFIRLTMKDCIEAAEVASLWFVDCDDLGMKVGFAEQCGTAAAHYRALAARLAGLGLEPFDPRQGGYSRFFGFLRSLTTPEERAAAGEVTLRTFQVGRLAILATLARERGDAETADLLGHRITDDLRHVMEVGWQSLITHSPNEECQARGRRAAFRIVELAGEVVEPLHLRKALAKRRSPTETA
jgi:hypothetical protein